MCDYYDETVDHLVSGCPVIRPTEYKNRHDRVGQYTIGRSTNVTELYTIKTGMNINQSLLLKQRAPQSFGVSQYIQI